MSSRAFLSPSASHRWLACPPSAKLCAKVTDQSSEYAKQGTDAHALCAYLNLLSFFFYALILPHPPCLVNTGSKENEVKWLEWQAHRLAPRVLMPFEMFKKKTLELIESYQNLHNDILPSCDTLIEDLSTFFVVSRVSVKYRLIEVGLLGQISNFEDFDAVFSEINNSEELVAITPVEAYQLMNLDSSLREWVSGGQFVFADGYFVLAEEKYIRNFEKINFQSIIQPIM